MIFYCHGGAFVVGPSRLEWSHAAKFASAIGCHLALYEYPKVPEHDSAETRAATMTAYELIAERYGAQNIAIAGLSAGGGLAVSTMLQLHRDGHSLPIATALFSPWLDMTVAHPDARTKVDTDKLLPIEILRRDGALYAGSMDPANPLLSPRFATAQELAAHRRDRWREQDPTSRRPRVRRQPGCCWRERNDSSRTFRPTCRHHRQYA